MEEKLLNLKNEAVSLILETTDIKTLEEIKILFLGRSGKVTLAMKEIINVPKEKRVEAGKLVNEVKQVLVDAIDTKAANLRQESTKAKKEQIDVTAPGIPPAVGHIHPMTQVLYEVVDVFKSIGFQAADGPEIETDYYNFTALNMSPDAPSRDTQATLYIDTRNTNTQPGEILLRTQTSNMQVRTMEKIKPPVRVIVPGKVFRVDDVDASHGFEFWQLEGFCVDTNVRFTDLLGTIDHVLRKIFGTEVKIKFATTNFSFVEPGVDTYIECTICKGKGCSFCKYIGWSEIMPAGMIHPNVLKAAGYNPQEVNGFAFAIGLSRLVTLRYQMDDLRLLTNPDLRILEQF